MYNKTIYVLHKRGSKNHYLGLQYLLESNNIHLKYREFSVFSKLFKSIIKIDGNLFKKQLFNISFLIELAFTKNKKIVLGIAPFDYKIFNLLILLKNHTIYYHTSWACWDKSFHPKTKKNNELIYKTWKIFLENHVKFIFTVSEASKKSLIKNYKLSESNIHVVNHAVDRNFEKNKVKKRVPKSFIYLGRLLEEKGLKELLDIFSNHRNLTFTIVGEGKKEDLVYNYSKKFKNIHFYKFITDKNILSDIMLEHEFVILNSKKTRKWEELFGMILVEGMAHGLIPVASKHAGPEEIISHEVGYLYDEGKFEGCLAEIISEYPGCKERSIRAKKEAIKYFPNQIAHKWKPILE